MMRRRWGRIIAITSVVGFTGNPGQGNYTASKAGIVGMMKSVAAEYAKRNITANCIAPGLIASAMTEKLNDKQREAIFARIPSATELSLRATEVYHPLEERTNAAPAGARISHQRTCSVNPCRQPDDVRSHAVTPLRIEVFEQRIRFSDSSDRSASSCHGTTPLPASGATAGFAVAPFTEGGIRSLEGPHPMRYHYRSTPEIDYENHRHSGHPHPRPSP